MNKSNPYIVKNIQLGITISGTVPAINSLSRHVTKYFEGTILLNNCIATGIEFIGKTRPESIIAGKNPANKAAWLAVNWFFKIVEINNPCPIAVERNNAENIPRTNKFPLNGILNSTIHIKTLKDIEIIPNIK